MSEFPWELLSEILSRLPVKSLLQFRSVSKSFRALIDSPQFINLHLNQSARTNKIFTFLRDGTFSDCYYSLYLDSHASTFTRLEKPFDSVLYFQQILGSCNGLICLSMGSYNRQILLWNPTTKKYRVIQTLPINYPPDSGVGYTIDTVGYDHVNDDYKIVRLSQCNGLDSKLVYSKVIVYSLNSNLWQSLEHDFPYYVCQRQYPALYCAIPMSHGVSVCGAIHWIVSRNPPPDKNYLIMAFQLDTQKFKLVPQVEYFEKYVSMELGILGGCLCVVGNNGEYCVDVWILKKYGVKESWRKLVSLTKSDLMENRWPSVKPMVYIKNGKEVVLELDTELFLRYDLRRKKSRITRIHNVSYLTSVAYQESLV